MSVRHCLVQLPGANNQWHKQVPLRSQIKQTGHGWSKQNSTGTYVPVPPAMLMSDHMGWKLSPTSVGSVQEIPVLTSFLLSKASWPKCSPSWHRLHIPCKCWCCLDHFGNSLFLVYNVCLHIRVLWLVHTVNAWPKTYGLNLSKAQIITKHSSYIEDRFLFHENNFCWDILQNILHSLGLVITPYPMEHLIHQWPLGRLLFLTYCSQGMSYMYYKWIQSYFPLSRVLWQLGS